MKKFSLVTPSSGGCVLTLQRSHETLESDDSDLVATVHVVDTSVESIEDLGVKLGTFCACRLFY